MPKTKFLEPDRIKFADIDPRSVYPETLLFLKSIDPDYIDANKEMAEDLISVETIFDAIGEANNDLHTPEAIHQAEQIYKEASKAGCSYLRIIS